VEALDDPYTAFLDPSAHELFLRSLGGKIEGIGAYVGVNDSQIRVIAPIADSPADRAGIRAGDVIVEINGQPTTGMSAIEAVLSIQGPKGTTVILRILHQDETEPATVEIVRAEIDVPSVSSEMKGGIAYIKISQFSERTAEELAPVLDSINGQAKGIILDLRSNPGGLLDTVVDVASFFLREGVVVDVVDNQGKRTAYLVKPSQTVTDLPMVVLVDSYSASGSETLVGALQDYGRATIAGARTYGKGSVTPLYSLKDGSGLYLTMARMLTPNGRLYEGIGLAPDYELKEDEDAIQWAINFLKSGQAP
jgi:carboxyl-terminal processing protease